MDENYLQKGFIDEVSGALNRGGDSSEWELLVEGSFGTTNSTKADIDLFSFGKKQYYVAVDFNKTTAKAKPAIFTPGISVYLDAAYESSTYAQKGLLYVELNGDYYFGYASILHGWGNPPQSKYIVFAPSPRGDGTRFSLASVQSIDSDETLGSYRVYGR